MLSGVDPFSRSRFVLRKKYGRKRRRSLENYCTVVTNQMMEGEGRFPKVSDSLDLLRPAGISGNSIYCRISLSPCYTFFFFGFFGEYAVRIRYELYSHLLRHPLDPYSILAFLNFDLLVD
jgi:hypothetical protein